MTPLGEQMLAATLRSSPRRAGFLGTYGDAPVGSVLDGLAPAPSDTVQDRADVGRAIRSEVGRQAGDLAARIVDTTGSVLTANHFGIDTFADSVQGTMLYAQWAGRRTGGPPAAVVLGFGSVSMNNLTYPMGLRLYELGAGAADTPVRLPVLPNRVKRCTVDAAEPFDEDMLARAAGRVRRLAAAGTVSPAGAQNTEEVITGDLATDEVLGAATYRAQSTSVNRALWRAMFAGDAPELVQVQAERVCAELLRADLVDPGSLAHRLVFAPEVRGPVLAALDGESGCWDRAALDARLAGTPAPDATGTAFFWATSPRRTRVPMALREDRDGPVLVGVDDRGGTIAVPFRPDAVATAVAERRLLPSLFLCFAVLAFARGLVCVGGYYQADYLPRMQKAVVASLRAAGDGDRADRVGAVPADAFLAGVQPVVRETERYALPAGPLEIRAGGGLSDADLRACAGVSVRQAVVASFPDVLGHLTDLGPWGPGWLRDVAAENRGRLDEVVRVRVGGPAGVAS